MAGFFASLFGGDNQKDELGLPVEWSTIQKIEFLERTHIYKNTSRYGDSYIAIAKGKNQLARDRAIAAKLRVAIGMD